MRYALIDNATITAIQRLLGDVKVYNKATIDMDILSMESYLESILFYDSLICLDDYKPEHKKQRKEFFPDIRFIEPDIINYSSIEEESIKIYNDITPKIQYGEFADEYFTSFFSHLKMHMVFTWDMASSEYFLTQKVLLNECGLDIDEYSKLMSSITDEAFLGYNLAVNPKIKAGEKKFKLLDSDGEINFSDPKYEGQSIKGISHKFQLFSTSLAWLAQRTIFYTLLSEYLHADLFLHPIRQSFNIVCLQKKASLPESKYKPLIDEMNSETEVTIKEIKSLTEPFLLSQSIPLFSVWLIDKVKTPSKMIELAYEIREKKIFQESRNKLRELNQLIESKENKKYVKNSNLLLSELKKIFGKLKTQYGIGTNQGIPLTKLISFGNIGGGLLSDITLPEIDYRIKELEFMKHIIPNKGFKGVYRSLINDIMTISRIGKYHELLTSEISLQRNASYYEAKTEESKYYGKRSRWKIPMN